MFGEGKLHEISIFRSSNHASAVDTIVPDRQNFPDMFFSFSAVFFWGLLEYFRFSFFINGIPDPAERNSVAVVRFPVSIDVAGQGLLFKMRE